MRPPLSDRLERLMRRREAALRPQPAAEVEYPLRSTTPGTFERRLAMLHGLREEAPPPAPPAPAPPPSAPAPTPSAAVATPTLASPRALDPISAQLDALRACLGGAPPAPVEGPDRQRLAALLPGQVRSTVAGPCYALCATRGPDGVHGDRPLGDVLGRDARDTALLARDALFVDFDPRAALYLDLETTGLSTGMGALPFLIGAAHFRGDRLILEQWLLRDPDEEAAALTDLHGRLADVDWLVTYNGRTFDLPLLETRCGLHRLESPGGTVMGHFDLLHASRRLLRHSLPNCRLGTVEAHRLGLHRGDDIPGSAVPATYRDYLHGGEPEPLAAVVAHNRDDILSMVTLLDLLLEQANSAETLALRDPPAALALARAALNIGQLDRAEAIFRASAEFPDTRAHGARGLAQVARRRRRDVRKE